MGTPLLSLSLRLLPELAHRVIELFQLDIPLEQLAVHTPFRLQLQSLGQICRESRGVERNRRVVDNRVCAHLHGARDKLGCGERGGD